MSHNSSTCSHCGKPLTDQACIACEGTGFTRELAFIKRECTACHGSGRVRRCEDEYKHIVDDFKTSHPAALSTPAPSRVRRHTHEPQKHNAMDSTPWHSIHPENPWNPNALNDAVKPESSPPVKHPSQRSSRKTSHEK